MKTNNTRQRYLILASIIVTFLLGTPPLRGASAPPQPPPHHTHSHNDPQPHKIHRDSENTKVSDALDYRHYERLLRKIVKENGLDFSILKAEITNLKRVTKQFSSFDMSKLNTMPRGQVLAYWINFYHVILLNAIASHPKVTSFLELGNEVIQPWNAVFIVIAKKRYSLDVILHEILRPNFQEPRIHCVISDFTVISPRLNPRAFRGATIAQALHDACESFVNDPRINTFSSKALELSPIFKLYPHDFSVYYLQTSKRFKSRDKNEKSFLSFIYRHTTNKNKRVLRKDNFIIQFRDFDWRFAVAAPATPSTKKDSSGI